MGHDCRKCVDMLNASLIVIKESKGSGVRFLLLAGNERISVGERLPRPKQKNRTPDPRTRYQHRASFMPTATNVATASSAIANLLR